MTRLRTDAGDNRDALAQEYVFHLACHHSVQHVYFIGGAGVLAIIVMSRIRYMNTASASLYSGGSTWHCRPSLHSSVLSPCRFSEKAGHSHITKSISDVHSLSKKLRVRLVRVNGESQSLYRLVQYALHGIELL